MSLKWCTDNTIKEAQVGHCYALFQLMPSATKDTDMTQIHLKNVKMEHIIEMQ